MRAASEAPVDGSIRTRKNPVGVSLIVTKGLTGSAEDAVFVGVGVTLPVGTGVVFPVGVGEPSAGVGEGDASCGDPDRASLTTADSLYPTVVCIFIL